MKHSSKILGIFGMIALVILGFALAFNQFAPRQEPVVAPSPTITAEPTVTLTPTPAATSQVLTSTPAPVVTSPTLTPTPTSSLVPTATPAPTPSSETELDFAVARIAARLLNVQKQAVYYICTQSSCGTASYVKFTEPGGSVSYYILTAAHILCDDYGDNCSRTAAVRRVSIGEPTNWYETRVIHIDWAKDVALLNPVTELRQVYASHSLILQREWFDTALPVDDLPSRGASMVAIASNGLIIEMVNDRESYSGSCSRPNYCAPVLGQALNGTSGSPVIDAHGRVVGIITGGWESDRQHIVITTGDGILKAISDAPASTTTAPLPTPTPSVSPTPTPVPTATPVNSPTPDPDWDFGESVARAKAQQLNWQMHAVYQICTLKACGTATYIRFTELDGSASHYILTAAHILCINDGDSCSSNAAVRRIFVGATDWYETRLLHIDWSKDIALLSPVDEFRLRHRYGLNSVTFEYEWIDVALSLAFLPPRGAELTAIASNAFTIEMVNNRLNYLGSCSSLDYCEPVLGQLVDGMSGSPVVDRFGKIVGIVTRGWKSDRQHVAIVTGDGIWRAIRDFQDSQ